MAIKFTDKDAEPEKPKKAAVAKPAPAEAVEPEPALPPRTPEAKGYLPGMAHEKPEPKPRGRKKAFG